MKNIFMIVAAFFFATTIFTGCGNDDNNSKNGSDLSNPEATINTLIKACTEKDKDGLSRCFSKNSEGEFKSIVDKTISDKDLNEMKATFEKASILSSEVEGSKAMVSLQLKNRVERIIMTQENENWVILEF